MNSINDDINVLRNLGYFLLPIPPRKKAPPPKEWFNHGNDYYIPDGSNVAIGTIDVAILITNDAEATEWARSRFGEPNVISPRGAHWYFRPLENQKNESNKQTSVGTLEFHVFHKYALIPPSIHPSGVPYKWGRRLPPINDLPTAPDLKDLFHPSGTHHSELLKQSAAKAHDGKSKEQIFGELSDWRDSHFPDPKTHADLEVWSMAESAHRKYHKEPKLDKQQSKEPKSGSNGATKVVYEALRLGPRHVMLLIKDEIPTVTRKDIGTDKEEIYCYDSGLFTRGEERIRQRANEIYVSKWESALESLKELLNSAREYDDVAYKQYKNSENELKRLLEHGPKGDKIDEVLKQIRLETFIEVDRFNPPTHIPFKNGLLNLETWKLEPHTPDNIYLWRVEANFLEDRLSNVSLLDTPQFAQFLFRSYEKWDIPLLLQYGGYTLYPSFPRQMVLWIVGRPRIGKGTFARILRRLNPEGYGALSFEKLMIAENRFAFQGIDGKNLLCDPEVKRKFQKGSRPDYGNFNKLFGGDTLDLEKKGKQSSNYISMAKGLFIANLPLPQINDEPFLSRILLIKALDRVVEPKERITDLDFKIVGKERDEIATLFVKCLKSLATRKWIFASEMTTDSTMEVWDLFSNAVQFYLEDMISQQDGGQIGCDDMYNSFKEWCGRRGIPTMADQTFKKAVGLIYPRKKVGSKYDRYRVFINCQFSDEVEVGHQSGSQKTSENKGFYDRYRRRPT